MKIRLNVKEKDKDSKDNRQAGGAAQNDREVGCVCMCKHKRA